MNAIDAFDAGLQNERTALAWRRTALSLVAAALVMAKVTDAGSGLAAAWGLVATPGALAMLLLSHRHYQARRVEPLHSAWPLVLSGSLATAGLGVLSLVAMMGHD